MDTDASDLPRFHIVTGNHGVIDGIEDFVLALRTIFEHRTIPVTQGDDFVAGVYNIVIDEFTDVAFQKHARRFKAEHSGTTYVFVLTEFVSRSYGIESFNLFGDVRSALGVAALKLRGEEHLFRATKKRVRRTQKTDNGFMVAVIAHRHYATVRTTLLRCKRWMKRHLIDERTRYMYRRYVGLKRCIDLADNVILAHSEIRLPRHSFGRIAVAGTLGYEFPDSEVERCFPGSDATPAFLMSGSITPYRRAVLEGIQSEIAAKGMSDVFHPPRINSFGDRGAVRERCMFSLHPPQSENWMYSSPTRIYRSLRYEHSIPVLTRHYDTEPIEGLCVVYRGSETLERLAGYIREPDRIRGERAKLMRTYNEECRRRNDMLLARCTAR